MCGSVFHCLSANGLNGRVLELALNVCALRGLASRLAAERLELLKEAVPGISRVLVLSHLVDPVAPVQVKALRELAPSLGLTLQIRDIRTVDNLPAALDAEARERAEGLLVTAESLIESDL